MSSNLNIKNSFFKFMSNNKKYISKFLNSKYSNFKFYNNNEMKEMFFKKINENNKNFDYSKIFSIFGALLLLKIKKELMCYKVNNKELEKFMEKLDKGIKDLEFKYKGTLRRHPVT